MILTIFKITTALIPIFAFTMGFYSLYRNPKSKVNVLWFLTSLAVGTWGLGVFLFITAINQESALQYGILSALGAAIIPAFLYHFVTIFLY